jgi:hypothetical protein
MTTVDKVLLTLEYVTKEQEEELVFPALDDVIDTFEDTFLSKAEEFKTAIDKFQSNFDQIDERVRDVTNNNTKLFAGALPAQLSLDASSDESEEDSPKRKHRRPSKSAKSLLSAFALTNDQIADGIADGLPTADLKQLAFPKQGLRIKVTSNNDVDIQIRIQLNKDSKTFKLQQRLNKVGWSTVNGGQKIKNFSAALRHGERLITDKVRDTGVKIPNPAIIDDASERKQAQQARRSWLLNNTFQVYDGTHPRSDVPFTGSDKEKNNYVDSFKQEIFKQLEHVGIDLKDLFKPSDIIFKADPNKKPSNLIIDALMAPWAIPIILLNGIAGGIITSFSLLGKIVDKISGGLFSTKYGPRSTVRANGKKDAPGSATWAARAYANNGTTRWWGVLAHAISQGFKEGWQEGQAFGRSIGGALKYRAPDNAMYRDNPRAYWKERGKLVTQLARMEVKYEDAIDKAKGLSDVNLIDGEPERREYRNPTTGDVQQVIVNPRSDAIEQAIVNYSKAEDRIENLARPLDVSLEAVRAHFNEILSGNSHTMPPGEGFPTRFGGYIKRRQLEKNVDKYVPKGSQGRGLSEAMMGKDPKFETLHEGQQGSRRLAQVEQDGGRGSIGTQDREYLKPGQQAPESVKEHYAERRGADGHQARYYSKKEAARILDEQKNGPDKRDSNIEEEGDEKSKPFYYSNTSDMTKVGENEMAPTNAPKTPQDPAAEQFQMATENEVAAAKRVSQKSKARSAKANARVAAAAAAEAEVKAQQAEKNSEVHIEEILHKLDSNISELVVKSNPGVSDVYSQLKKTIDTIEKDISNSFRRGRNAGENNIEGVRKQYGGPSEINAPKILMDNLSRAFREAGKGKKAKKKDTTETATELPDSPESTTDQPELPKTVEEQLGGTPTTSTKPSTPTITPTTSSTPTTTPKSPVAAETGKLRSAVDIAREKQGMSPRSTTGTSSGAGGAGGAGGSKPFYYSDKNDLRRKKRRKK